MADLAAVLARRKKLQDQAEENDEGYYISQDPPTTSKPAEKESQVQDPSAPTSIKGNPSIPRLEKDSRKLSAHVRDEQRRSDTTSSEHERRSNIHSARPASNLSVSRYESLNESLKEDLGPKSLNLPTTLKQAGPGKAGETIQEAVSGPSNRQSNQQESTFKLQSRTSINTIHNKGEENDFRTTLAETNKHIDDSKNKQQSFVTKIDASTAFMPLSQLNRNEHLPFEKLLPTRVEISKQPTSNEQPGSTGS
eukprot:755416-Hanusia_phi.AAC.1